MARACSPVSPSPFGTQSPCQSRRVCRGVRRRNRISAVVATTHPPDKYRRDPMAAMASSASVFHSVLLG